MARLLVFAMWLVLSAKTAWADTGVQSPSIPGLSIYDALVEGDKRFRRAGDETQGENQFQLRTGVGHSEGHLGLLLGARVAAATRTENAVLSAESRVTALRHGDPSTGLRGYHRLFGLYFLGESGDEIGADIMLDARFRHREGLRFRLDAPRLMGDLAYSGSATLGATFRYGSDEMALAVPLRYQFGGDAWRNSALRQVIRHRASMGIGFMPHTRERLRGAVEALQLSAEYQSFRHVSGVERTTENTDRCLTHD